MDAIAVPDTIPKRSRTRLLNHFVQLRSSPGQYSDSHEHDSTGRRIEISIWADYSIHYWIDFADRHVKVLAIKIADR
jgi:hypothetical protein